MSKDIMSFRQTHLFNDYETNRNRMEELYAMYGSGREDRNEAQTRLELVDNMFFGCLGWSLDDVEVEHPYGREYADYVFSAPRRVLIVEAKRESRHFSLPAGYSRTEVAIQSLFRDYPDLKAAMVQVGGYCQKRGIPLGCVCNGHQIVGFVASRNDGRPPYEGRAVVFSSLKEMLDDFLTLWNLFSKRGIEDKNLQYQLVGDSTPRVPARLSESIPGYPGTVSRNIFQTDLQILSDVVIEDIVKDKNHEAEFIEACYSKSGALSQYSLISKKILEARYASIFDESNAGPTLTAAVTNQGVSPELMAESLSRRPILLIGDVGVGKTMFIRNLINVEAPEVFRNAITLYIDLGTQATLTEKISSYINKEIEKQLVEKFDVDIREDGFVRAVYHGELRKFEKGIYGRLKESNLEAFREKEIERLEELMSDRNDHLKYSLLHLSKMRKKQIVMFFDNVDQRNEETQQKCFLIAQELADSWPATIFVTLRPETYHRSHRMGAISGYHPKAFTIAPPRVLEVVKKRLRFALKLTAGEIPIQNLISTQVNLKSLDVIIRVFLDSLNNNKDLAEAIDNVSGGNVRLALDLVSEFFGSGHVDTKKIYDKAINNRGRYIVPIHEFIRSIIYGNNKHYSPARSPIADLFDVSTLDGNEHFLLPALLTSIDTLSSANANEGFVSINRAYDLMQSIGFTPDQIDYAVIRAHRDKLLETSARRIPQPDRAMPHSIRITTIGKYHAERLCHYFQYLDAVVVDTPILLPDYRDEISQVSKLAERLDRAEIFCGYLDQQWNQADIDVDKFNWPSASESIKEDISKVRGITDLKSMISDEVRDRLL